MHIGSIEVVSLEAIGQSLVNVIINEFKKYGVNANVGFKNGVLEVVLTKQEIENIILSRVPQEFKNAVEVYANDITIKLKVV